VTVNHYVRVRRCFANEDTPQQRTNNRSTRPTASPTHLAAHFGIRHLSSHFLHPTTSQPPIGQHRSQLAPDSISITHTQPTILPIRQYQPADYITHPPVSPIRQYHPSDSITHPTISPIRQYHPSTSPYDSISRPHAHLGLRGEQVGKQADEDVHNPQQADGHREYEAGRLAGVLNLRLCVIVSDAVWADS